jgi:hypothetical protein
VLVCCLGSDTFKWPVGVINSLSLNYRRWIEKMLLLSPGAPDSLVHIRHVRCPSHVSRPLRFVAVNCWSRPLARLSGAHRTIQCYSTRESLDVDLSAQTVRCTPDMSGVPPERWLTSIFLDFFTISLGFFWSWVLDFYASFRFSFEVLHPQSLSRILFTSCELQTQTLANTLVHGLCWSSNTKIN